MPTTPNFGFTQPVVGADANTWGANLNTNWGLLDTLLRQAMPIGAILLWSGSLASVPAGWALCDGTSGRPDLRDRFVVGAGPVKAPNAVGGRETITEVMSHTHAVGTLAVDAAGGHNHTVTDPGHNHTVTDGITDISGSDNLETGTRAAVRPNTTVRTTSSNATGITLAAVANHAHPLSGTPAVPAGAVASINILPPYYALAYIIKT